MIENFSPQMRRGLDPMVEENVDHNTNQERPTGERTRQHVESKHSSKPPQHEGNGKKAGPYPGDQTVIAT